MVILDIKLDNIMLFKDFSLNLSYPKKLVHTSIEGECLEGRPNFRYKKLVILMGANATGKTALGKALRGIFNFIARREYAMISSYIEDPKKDAFFSIEMAAFPDNKLYRISATFKAGSSELINFNSDSIIVEVKSEEIKPEDSYEKCVERLNKKTAPVFDNYIQALESVPYLTWKFLMSYVENISNQNAIIPVAPNLYAKVLKNTLTALDPRVEKVEKINGTNNTFIIQYKNHSVLIKDGVIMEPYKLSSGTMEGVDIADLLTVMHVKAVEFFYCDEKFAHVHSASEKAFLSMLIEMLGPNQQLFFTTHNTDVADMNIPFHSYAILRRDEFDDNMVSCVFASEYLKKNNQSLKNAIDNDMFSATPNTDNVYAIRDALVGGNS